MDECALLIFTKAPVPGKVKTRLVPLLGKEGAAELYKSLIRRTLRTARSSSIKAIQLWVAPDTRHPELLSLSQEYATGLYTQQGKNLGERMHYAISNALDVYAKVIVIGCDCPALTANLLDEACRKLTAGSQVVLGPAEDGGYYLIGVNYPYRGLFTEIEWGGSSVLAKTRERLQGLNLQWSELDRHWDLDMPEDLQRYQNLVTAS